MQVPPPPTQQQAEEAQRIRHTAELSVLSLFAGSATGGGSSEQDSSSLISLRLLAILTLLSTEISQNSFSHANSDGRPLLRPINHDKIADSALESAETAFNALQASDLPDDQKAVLWATGAYSEVSHEIARAVNDTLTPPEFGRKKLKKVWISRSDRRVRPLHARLHGKVVPASADFWRWPQTGQRLRWPGDRSAPADATMGCRCVSLLTWSEQDEVSDTIRRLVESSS